MLYENVAKKVKVKMSFGHKAVISSLSKLNIKSKNFCYIDMLASQEMYCIQVTQSVTYSVSHIVLVS